MSPSETFQVVVLKNPEGVLVSDVFSVEAGRRRPIVFKKVGEVINLMTVDVKSFVTSARTGLLRSMEIAGSITKVQQETSVHRTDEILAEWRRQGESLIHAKGNSSQAQVVLLEPGVQVAVGGGQIAPGGGGNATELEPGVYAPGAAEESVFASVSKVDAEAKDAELPVVGLVDEGIGAVAATTGVSLDDVTEVHGAPAAVAVEEAAPSWKDGKTLSEQEEFITTSTDKKFLRKVLNDVEESRGLRNLAKKTLAALK